MEVWHLLPRLGAGVDHQPVASVGDVLGLGQLVGDMNHMSEEMLLFGGDVSGGEYVSLGHDEHVRRCLRVDIADGDNVVILVEDVARYLSGDDATEYAVLFH